MTTSEQSGNTSTTVEGSETKIDSGAELLKLQKLLEQTTAERDNLRVKNRELKGSTGNGEALQKQLDDLLAEKSKLAEDFEGYKGKIKQKELDTNISTALEANGVKSMSAALKLLDRSMIQFDGDTVKIDSVAAAIKALKEAEPILFKEESADPNGASSGNTSGTKEPTPKPAVQGGNAKTAYETEIRAAKSVKEIEAVMRKYGKGQ
jgi:hypothetical protein